MNNIYIDTGNVIKSSVRYVPREFESIINKIFLNPDFFGSVAISGLHKVGKTTLIEQKLNQIEEELFNKNIIYIYVYMATYTDAEDFFNDLAFKIFEILEDNEIELNKLIEKKYLRFQNEKTRENRDSFFRIISKKLNYKIIFCIDEFDKAITIFKYNSSYFQILRNFPSEFNISMLYISRRDIYYIEEKSPHNSTFANSFEGHYFLTMYSNKEIKIYFEILSNYFVIDNTIKEIYCEITGFYPYLMDILSKELIKNCKNKTLSLEYIYQIFQKNIDIFNHQYKQIKQILIEEQIYDELLSIVFYNKIQDANKKILLVKYGILNYIDNKLDIFCKSFLEYIKTDISKQNINFKDMQQLDIYKLVECIDNMILIINDTNKNINHTVIFNLTYSESENRKKFNTICINKSLFSSFVGAMYLTVFERTSKSIKNRSKNLDRLPKKFQREHNFIRLVDSVRHNFGGHDTRSENWKKTARQLSRSEILSALKDNVKEPQDVDEEYLTMQIKLLKLFQEFLDELYEYIE